MIVSRLAYWNASTSNSPSSPTNFIRLRDARLQLVSLRKLNSEHGFVAYWRSELATGFQSLMVVSYWMPGSPQTHAASAISWRSLRAGNVSIGAPPTTAWVVHSPSATTARMYSSVTRTEWLAFWKAIEPYASPVKLGS